MMSDDFRCTVCGDRHKWGEECPQIEYEKGQSYLAALEDVKARVIDLSPLANAGVFIELVNDLKQSYMEGEHLAGMPVLVSKAMPDDVIAMTNGKQTVIAKVEGEHGKAK